MHGIFPINTLRRILSGLDGRKQGHTMPTTFILVIGWATRTYACSKEYSCLASREDTG